VDNKSGNVNGEESVNFGVITLPRVHSIDYRCEDGRSSGVHGLRDSFKPRFAFQQSILKSEAEKSTYLIVLDVRKPGVVSISQRSEEL
jgi:hypothetical protein